MSGMTVLLAMLAATLPLTVEARARAYEPGEPVRVLVGSAEPLDRLSGSFDGRPIHFVALDGARNRWAGWSLIPLDREPGTAVIEVAGSAGERSCAGTRALAIAAREFPEENLSVASRYVKPPPDVERRLERERNRLAGIYGLRGESAALAPFVKPVAGERTSVFGTRRLFNGQPRSPHPGVDLRAEEGDPVRASGPGTVVLATDLYYSGNTVIVDHGGGLFTLYAHLSRIDVLEGEEVEAGRRVGLAGATGRVTGPHLHWGAKIGDRPFDPAALTDPALFE